MWFFNQNRRPWAALACAGIWAAAAAQAAPRPGGAVPVGRSAENEILRLQVAHYQVRDMKLGDPAPDGIRFLVVRGSLQNLNPTKGISIPPADKAFPLRLNEDQTLQLDPMSAYTADPIWGPLVLQPGETYPFEMVFVMPDIAIDSLVMRHLSNKGPIHLQLEGDAPAPAVHYISGPVREGNEELGVIAVQHLPEYNGRTPPPGKVFLSVTYELTNRMPLAPLETDFASLSQLVEQGNYTYRPLPVAGKRGPDVFDPGVPVRGILTFAVPENADALFLVHFTKAGALTLPLSPEAPVLEERALLAGPVGDRSIRIALCAPPRLQTTESGATHLVLDIGLRLNHRDPLAFFLFQPMKSLELHSATGRVLTPKRIALRRPLLPGPLWRDLMVCGEVAFPATGYDGTYSLVIPFSGGPTRLPLPTTSAAPPAPVRSPTPAPAADATPAGQDRAGATVAQRLPPRQANDLAGIRGKGGVVVIFGIASGQDEVDAFAKRYDGTARISYHVSMTPTAQMHPLEIKKLIGDALHSAGFPDVQVRMRKRDELILMGTVGSQDDAEQALAMARLMPGIAKVVDLLKTTAAP